MVHDSKEKKRNEVECFIKYDLLHIKMYCESLIFNSHLMMRLNTRITLLPKTLYL